MTATTPSDIFRFLAVNATSHALDLVQKDGDALTEHTRNFALNHLKGYGLEVEEAWPLTRDLLLRLAPFMEREGDRNDSILQLQSAIEQSQAMEDQETEMELRFHLSLLLQHQGQIEESSRHCEICEKFYAATGKPLHRGRVFTRLGLNARTRGSLKEAEEYARLALKYIGAAPLENGYVYLLLARVAYDQRDWDTSLELYQKSLEFWEMTGDPRQIGFGLTNLGSVLWGLNRLEDAAGYYERAIDLLGTVKDPVHQAVARMNLGVIFYCQGRYQEAIALFKQVEEVKIPRRDPIRLAQLYNNWAMALQGLKRWEEAERSYEMSLSYWRLLGNIEGIADTLEGFGTLYTDQGLYDRAIEIFQEGLRLLKEGDPNQHYKVLYDILSDHLANAQRALDNEGDSTPDTSESSL